MNQKTSVAAGPSVVGHPLDALFNARSVCIVGISRNENTLIGAPLPILRRNGFEGDIYLVNPNVDEIGGLQCYASVDDLPVAPEAALIMVRAELVPGVVDKLGRMGTKAAIVLSSGFEETGKDSVLVEELRAVVRRHGMILVGPNCEGVWSVRNRLILTFGSAARRDNLKHGPVAILSQSGSIAGGIVRHMQDAGFGCAYLVSVGNETCLDILDFLEYVVHRGDVKVVAMFIEGLKGGQRLCDLVAAARAKGITICALKAGNSALGGEAISSHTGKMATSGVIYADIFDQAGIIQVHSLVELLEAAQVLSTMPLPKVGATPGSGVSILSIPGGTRALTADACEEYRVPLARFESKTEAALGAVLPEFGYGRNPIDMTGQVLSRPEMFQSTLDLVVDDPNTEAFIVQLANSGPRDLQKYREMFAAAARRLAGPVFISMMGDSIAQQDLRAFAEEGVFAVRDPADAVRCLALLYRAREHQTRRNDRSPAEVPTAGAVPGSWSEWMAFLESNGIAIPGWAVIGPDGDVEGRSSELQFPVVVKAMPTEFEHKTEANLVRLGIADEAEMHRVADEIRRALGDANARVLVQEQIASSLEAVVTVAWNPDFGPVLAIGTGGVLVELLYDVRYLSLPATVSEIDAAVDSLKLCRLMAGFRGQPPRDRSAFVNAVARFASAVGALGPVVREIELNPVMIGGVGEGLIAVDLMVK